VEEGDKKMSDLDEFLSDESNQALPSDAETSRISTLAQEMNAAKEDVAIKEAELGEAKEKYRAIEETYLPDALAAAGVTEIALLDGTKVKVDDVVRCGLPKDEAKREKAMRWLSENKGDDIIDRVVAVKFKRGETEEMKALAKLLKDHGYAADVAVGVHYQTLSSWAKEKINEGMAIPEELFNLFVGKKAKLTKPKGGK
jgi:hypothetical protein